MSQCWRRLSNTYNNHAFSASSPIESANEAVLGSEFSMLGGSELSVPVATSEVGFVGAAWGWEAESSFICRSNENH